MEHIILTTTNRRAAIKRGVQVLSAGGLVIFPTETMYGVGVDATNPEAVTTLLRYKNRPAGKPISVMVDSKDAAKAIVTLNSAAEALYKSFLPGPVTIISEDLGIVDARLISEFGTLGIRISSHDLARQLSHSFSKPITCTSANASGKSRSYSIATTLVGLSGSQIGLIDLILDEGELAHREPSTVIDTTTEIQEIVRAGERLEELMPKHESNCEAQTIEIAHHIMQSFLHVLPEKLVVFALEGEMGAGKTHFAKGIAKALHIDQVVSSPTYTLMKEYEFEGNTMIHMDCWRLAEVNPEEFGLQQYVKPNTVLVIEWAKPLLPFLKNQKDLVGYHIFIESPTETTRLISFGAL